MPKMKNKKLIKGYGKLMLRVILFLLLVFVFFTKVLFFARVEGMQMFPSLKDGDLAVHIKPILSLHQLLIRSAPDDGVASKPVFQRRIQKNNILLLLPSGK